MWRDTMNIPRIVVFMLFWTLTYYYDLPVAIVATAVTVAALRLAWGIAALVFGL